MSVDSEYADLGRRRAALVARQRELEIERGQVAVELEKLDTRLTEMLAAETQVRLRVPAWAEERTRWTVMPGHGAETSRLRPDSPALSHLSTAVPCGQDCVVREVHSHYADGVVQIWEQSGS